VDDWLPKAGAAPKDPVGAGLAKAEPPPKTLRFTLELGVGVLPRPMLPNIDVEEEPNAVGVAGLLAPDPAPPPKMDFVADGVPKDEAPNKGCTPGTEGEAPAADCCPNTDGDDGAACPKTFFVPKVAGVGVAEEEPL